jgi:hypothetical protein
LLLSRMTCFNGHRLRSTGADPEQNREQGDARVEDRHDWPGLRPFVDGTNRERPDDAADHITDALCETRQLRSDVLVPGA